MDPLTYVLAFGRIAPVQVAWWGHPDTSGISTIDYFVTSDTDAADAHLHHSEQLVRFSTLGTYFRMPEEAKPTAAVGGQVSSEKPNVPKFGFGTADRFAYINIGQRAMQSPGPGSYSI